MNNSWQEKRHLLSVIGAVLIWSVSFVATKVAFRTFPPLTLGALRFALAAIVLGIILHIIRGFSWPKRDDLVRLMISGILGITVYFSMENLGVKLATAADASLIVASYPAITMLLEMAFFHKKISRIRFFGVGLAMFGVYLIVRESLSMGGPLRLWGDIILATTGIVWAFYNFITRKIVSNYSTTLIAFYQMAAGAVAFLPLTLIEREQWRAPTTSSLLALLYLGVFCSLIAFLLYAYGLKGLTSSSAVTLMNLVPVFGVLFSMLFLRETISAIQLAGGFVVITGIALSIRGIEAI